MLGNQVELWETMLAVDQARRRRSCRRPRRRAGRPASTALIVAAPGSWWPTWPTREVRGGSRRLPAHRVWVAVDGWLYDYADSMQRKGIRLRASPPRRTRCSSTSPPGTTSRPKLVEHTQVSYPVGHLSTMYWLGARPGDVHLAISSPGWAKHAWSCFFAPWIAEATICVFNYSRFDAAALLEQIRAPSVTTFCAPPTVWRMLIQADLAARQRRVARGRRARASR